MQTGSLPELTPWGLLVAGTLTPIVNNPDEAIMTPQVRCLRFLRNAHHSCIEPVHSSVTAAGWTCQIVPSAYMLLLVLLCMAMHSTCTHPLIRCACCYTGLLQMRDTVRQVAHLFPTAIISGRGRDKVEAFVQLPELFYAGSHGMDIAGPRVSISMFADSSRCHQGNYTLAAVPCSCIVSSCFTWSGPSGPCQMHSPVCRRQC